MTRLNKRIWTLTLTFALVLLVPVLLPAQQQVGGLYGMVTAPEAMPLVDCVQGLGKALKVMVLVEV